MKASFLVRGVIVFLLMTQAPSYAHRVVTLAPNLTEMVYAVGAGDELVGVSEYSDFPPPAKKLPVVTRLGKVNLEALLVLKPDLVLIWKEGQWDPSFNLLPSFGVDVQSISTKNLKDIPQAIKKIGVLTGHSREAEVAAKAFLESYEHLKQTKPIGVTRVFLEEFDSPLYTPGRSSFLTEILSLCGGENVFSEIQAESSPVSIESVMMKNPDVIIALKPASIQLWQAWPAIEAVKKRRVFEVDSDTLARPGPRVLQGAKEVCRLMAL
jgi:ABC-type Fe3+-hydroxamate transport system substrate-binding protein